MGCDCPPGEVILDAKRPVIWVAAICMLDRDGRVLVAQRPDGKAMAGLWEFPGGKIEPGEQPEGALIRECSEELGIKLCLDCLSPLTFASHSYETFHLFMPTYLTRDGWKGVPTPQEGQTLKWARPAELLQKPDVWPMPPADLPLLTRLIEAV